MAVYLNCTAENGLPAARVGDAVSCPIHGTATIVSGSTNTNFNGQPAARVGDKTSCGDTIIEGCEAVRINARPAAVVGCTTAHGGKIISGSPTVFIGRMSQGDHEEEEIKAYSMSLDWSIMQEAGDHNGISHAYIPVKITKPDGSYLTTISTDERGRSRRFYTKDQEDILVWPDFGDWQVSEEVEEMDYDAEEEA